MIARINFARKVRCHSGTVEIVERAAVPSSGRGSSRSGRSRETAGEAWVRGAQLCKTGKAGAASFADVRARNIKDGPAPNLDHFEMFPAENARPNRLSGHGS
jgi:hypothetical protein